MTAHLPTMPPTKDREPYDPEYLPGYLEGDLDWAKGNPEALTWLIDNHEAIRAALNTPSPQTHVDVPIVKAVCQHCERVTVVPAETIRAAIQPPPETRTP